MDVQFYTKCTCGAITICIDEQEYSVKKTKLRRFFPDIDLRTVKRHTPVYLCDHCVNHYGLDLYACGSGLPYEKCHEFNEDICGKPMQKIGEYTRIRDANAWV